MRSGPAPWILGYRGREFPAPLGKAIAEGKVGGIILFRDNLGDSIREALEVREKVLSFVPAGAPFLLTIDEEGGLIHPTAGLRDAAETAWPAVPTPRALGRIDKVAETRWVGQILGERLRLLGFHLDFAPALDLDTEAENPVIGSRSFGTNPDRVAALGWGFARGLASTRTGFCFKHYPGHGGTREDSHAELARLRPESREEHERPFVDVLTRDSSEMSWIMSGHLDAGDGRPASLSGAALSRLERLGRDYLIVTDSLDMGAVSLRDGAVEQALLAHNDVLMVARDWEMGLETVHQLEARVETEPALLAALVRSRSRIRDTWVSLARRRRGPGSGPSLSDSDAQDRAERLRRLHRSAVRLDRAPDRIPSGGWVWCLPAGLRPYTRLEGWSPPRAKRRVCENILWIPEGAGPEELAAVTQQVQAETRPVLAATLLRGRPPADVREAWRALLTHRNVQAVAHLIDEAWPEERAAGSNPGRGPAVICTTSGPHPDSLTGLADALDSADAQWRANSDGWYFRVDSES